MKTMRNEFVVIDHDGDVSFSAAKEKSEKFATSAEARARALALAKTEPGKEVKIYELLAVVVAPVGPAETKWRR